MESSSVQVSNDSSWLNLERSSKRRSTLTSQRLDGVSKGTIRPKGKILQRQLSGNVKHILAPTRNEITHKTDRAKETVIPPPLTRQNSWSGSTRDILYLQESKKTNLSADDAPVLLKSDLIFSPRSEKKFFFFKKKSYFFTYKKSLSQNLDKKCISSIIGPEIISTFRGIAFESEPATHFKFNGKPFIYSQKYNSSPDLLTQEIIKTIEILLHRPSLYSSEDQVHFLNQPNLQDIFASNNSRKKENKKKLIDELKEAAEKGALFDVIRNNKDHFSLGFQLWAAQQDEEVVEWDKTNSLEFAKKIQEKYVLEKDFSVWGQHIPTLAILQTLAPGAFSEAEITLQKGLFKHFKTQNSKINVQFFSAADQANYEINIQSNGFFNVTHIRKYVFYRKDAAKTKLATLMVHWTIHGHIDSGMISADLECNDLTFKKNATSKEQKCIKKNLEKGKKEG